MTSVLVRKTKFNGNRNIPRLGRRYAGLYSANLKPFKGMVSLALGAGHRSRRVRQMAKRQDSPTGWRDCPRVEEWMRLNPSSGNVAYCVIVEAMNDPKMG